MADRSIILKDFEIRAIFDGRKTQKRTIFQPPLPFDMDDDISVELAVGSIAPKIKAGDRLWVKENWQVCPSFAFDDRDVYEIVYLADRSLNTIETVIGDGKQERLTTAYDRLPENISSILMPRWISRLTLLVTEVCVHRLQEIRRDEAIEEGIVQTWGDFFGNPPKWAIASTSKHGGASGSHIYDNRTSVENYRAMWEYFHGDGSWDANPWVTALTFDPIPQNIDAIAEADHA